MRQKRDDTIHRSFTEPEQTKLVKVMSWMDGMEQLHMYIGSLFVRSEQRERVLAYLKGLLSSAERKNGWQIAQAAGEFTPYGMQRLLSNALWDAEALRDSLQSYVKDQLSDTEATLVLDEVDFLKKGNGSVGVALQFCERVHSYINCQIGIVLAYAGTKGQILLDRALYLPAEWTENASRRAKVQVPMEVTFTKDELDSSGVPHDVILRKLPRQKWQVSPYGEDDPYGWALLKFDRRLQKEQEWSLWTLGCRKWGTRVWDSGSISRYRVFAPDGTTLEEMIQVLGQCGRVKDRIDRARKEVGLDQYEVRSWNGWHRHITLSMYALAFITAMYTQGIEQEEHTNAVESLSGFKLRRGLFPSEGETNRGESRVYSL